MELGGNEENHAKADSSSISTLDQESNDVFHGRYGILPGEHGEIRHSVAMRKWNLIISLRVRPIYSLVSWLL